MSRETTATINHQLTAFAQGHMNDLAQAYALANRLCPIVPVPGAHGQYKVFNDDNSFTVYNTERAMGGDPTRIRFSATDAYFNCSPQALEITVDEHERTQAGAEQDMLWQDKITALTNARALSFAHKRVAFVLANTTAEAGLGNFSSPDVDPVATFDKVISDLALACGAMTPIQITLDWNSWRIIRNHPLVSKRATGVQVSGISIEQFASMLSTPVDIMAANVVFKSTQQATTKTRLLAGNVLFTYSVPNPTRYDPSAFKCFTAGPNNVASVRTWQALNGLYEGAMLDWTEDLKLTSSKAVKRLAITVPEGS